MWTCISKMNIIFPVDGILQSFIEILVIFVFRYIFYHWLHYFIICANFKFFIAVLPLFTNSIFAVYYSSVNYAFAVSSPPFLLDVIFSPEIFRILWKDLWLYYWQAKHSSDSLEQLLGTFFLLIIRKNPSMTSFRPPFFKKW